MYRNMTLARVFIFVYEIAKQATAAISPNNM
jgi:hypothetical protein